MVEIHRHTHYLKNTYLNKMKIIINIFVLVLVLSCSTSPVSTEIKDKKLGKNIENIDPTIKNLFMNYGNKVFEAIYCDTLLYDLLISCENFAEKEKKISLKIETQDFFNYINEMSHDRVDLVLIDISNELSMLKDNVRREKYLFIHYWCEASEVIYKPFTFLKNLNTFADILYEVELTKPLLDKYITDAGQSPSSLSSNQVNALYYETLSYIAKLDPQKQFDFFIEYFKTAKKLSD